MPRQNSTWAWSSWRVRSPIQIMWPEVAYQSPEVESTRVIACFVAEQQRFVAGEEIGLAQRRMALGVDADRPHEVHGLGDAVGQRPVALRLGAAADEAEHPLMDVVEIGVAALREGAQEVERRRRLPVGHHPGAPGFGMREASSNSMPLTMSPR